MPAKVRMESKISSRIFLETDMAMDSVKVRVLDKYCGLLEYFCLDIYI